MEKSPLFSLLTILIATVWLVNGLVCKVLGWVPRHQHIVGRILGEEHAPLLTLLIGIAEIGMAVWVVLGIARKVNASLQIGLVIFMNVLEFILVPNLLLWGQFNIIFALAFAGLVYYHGFVLGPKVDAGS